MFFVILLFALFASLFTLQKETLQFCEPFFLVGFRMSLAGLLLLAYSTLKEKNITFKLSHIKHLIMLSTFQIYLANICEIWSLKYMESAKVCLIFSLSPFLSALIAFLVLRETLSVKKWWGMIIGFIGLIPIIFTNTSQESSSGSFFIFSYAELVLLIGGILSLIHSFAAGENWQPIPVNNFSAFLIYSTIMCLISNIICYNLYGFLLKKFSATFMSFAGLITPIFASLFGFVFLKENITWQFFASMLLFSIGLFVFHKQEIYIANTAK